MRRKVHKGVTRKSPRPRLLFFVQRSCSLGSSIVWVVTLGNDGGRGRGRSLPGGAQGRVTSRAIPYAAVPRGDGSELFYFPNRACTQSVCVGPGSPLPVPRTERLGFAAMRKRESDFIHAVQQNFAEAFRHAEPETLVAGRDYHLLLKIHRHLRVSASTVHAFGNLPHLLDRQFDRDNSVAEAVVEENAAERRRAVTPPLKSRPAMASASCGRRDAPRKNQGAAL